LGRAESRGGREGGPFRAAGGTVEAPSEPSPTKDSRDLGSLATVVGPAVREGEVVDATR